MEYPLVCEHNLGTNMLLATCDRVTTFAAFEHHMEVFIICCRYYNDNRVCCVSLLTEQRMFACEHTLGLSGWDYMFLQSYHESSVIYSGILCNTVTLQYLTVHALFLLNFEYS